MKFYTQEHQYYCGIDLHARKMYVCIIDHKSKTIVHKNIDTDAEQFFELIFPYLEDIVVAVECMFSWYWVSDLCTEHQIPFIVGHALYMRSIHGAKTKNDKIDSYKIAKLVRGGNFPLAYAYPKDMRATRDLMRRRTFYVRRSAELLAHIQNTNTQYNLPAFDKKISRKYNRDGVVDRFEDPAVQSSIAADLSMIDAYHKNIVQLEWQIEKSAKHHDHHTYLLLKTVPGIGSVLALTILYEICTIERFPSVGDFSSYCRLIRPEKESNGKQAGKGNGKIGNAHLKWAIREAATILLRESKPAKQYKDRLAKKYDPGKAMGILTHKLGRSIYFMLKNKEPFNMNRFLGN